MESTEAVTLCIFENPLAIIKLPEITSGGSTLFFNFKTFPEKAFFENERPENAETLSKPCFKGRKYYRTFIFKRKK